ncbi:MAG: SDR family oxidoreductase [Nostoc sp.]
MSNWETQDSLEPIAIIGMTGRFPGANNIEKFWQNLVNGVESITFFTDEELIASGVDPALVSSSNYVKAKGVLEDIEMFDALFFGFTPKEAELMDPQHRLFLECAWEALENAGYDSEAYDGRIGVYAGAGLNVYLIRNLASNPNQVESVGDLQISIGNDKDYVPTRVSYKLNLTGPSVNVNTACSTSLVAVQMACQSLLNYQCDMALAGGVSIYVPQKEGYLYHEGGIASPDGHCRAFDARAQGSIDGNGVGIVVLKRLEDALADSDYIYAVIRGSAINNDGSLKVGYTAPSQTGQAAVISEALSIAGIEAQDITYVETHGTGTPLGDPIEIAALTQAFRRSTQKKDFCAIGSVKTNIGHLDAAAGVTGIIKTALALKHKLLPPSLNFKEPSPNIDFANSPFYVNTTLSEWKTNGTPRRAGVSSFGIGGTNVHVVLEEAPVEQTRMTSAESRPWQLLVLSAKTSSALETATKNLVSYLQQHPDINFADVAHTLQVGRRTFNHRKTVVCRDREDAIVALQDPKRVLTTNQEIQQRSVAFMFSGLGTHYVNMAWELYQLEPTFQEQVDRCCQLLKPHIGLDLRNVLYPHKQKVDTDFPEHKSSSTGLDLRKMLARGERQADVETLRATSLLNQTFLTQPAIFVIEYALAKLWISWGIYPKTMIGYSIGEYVAATLAEVLSLEEALTLVAKRAQMIQELPGGAMLAVPLSEKDVQPLLSEELSLSAINGLSACVIAGSVDAVEKLEQQLTKKGLACRRLETSHAFHSQMMEAIAPAFCELVKTFNLQPPKIPYLSNVTGTWITDEQATDPSYWVQHLCQAVRFADGVQQLWKKHQPILLEVGPGQTLSSLALQCIKSENATNQTVLPSLKHSYEQQPDLAFLLNTLGRLTLAGVQIDWSGFYAHEQPRRLPLPTYPFERQRYWIEAQQQLDDAHRYRALLGKKPDAADWFYLPFWKPSVPPVICERENLIEESTWLVFADDCGLAAQLVKRLEQDNQDVITVKVGSAFTQQGDSVYTLNPQQPEDYDALICRILAQEKIPKTIVHLWSVTNNDSKRLGLEEVDTQDLGLYSLIFLAQALGKNSVNDRIQLTVVSNNLQAVTTQEALCPQKATLIGAVKVIPQEYLNFICRSIDIVVPESGSPRECELIERLLTEAQAESSEAVVAYRGSHRWVQTVEPVRLNKSSKAKFRLKEGGVYLITGGLGGAGFTLAEHLAKTVQAKLILLGRSVPVSDEWVEWLATHGEDNDISRKIRKVQKLEQFGAEVLVVSADVANEEQMQTAIAKAQERFGQINGVIHTAGLADYAGVIQRRTKEMTESILAPKLRGTLIIDKLLGHTNLDFFILFSSLSTTLYKTKFGQVGYSAGNEFLDAFSYYKASQNTTFTVSINWDDWQEVGMAVEALKQAVERNYGILEEQYLENALLPSEGVDVFMRVLENICPRIVVSTEDLKVKLELHNSLSAIDFETLGKVDLSQTVYPRPNLNNAYVAPGNRMQQTIADIWQQLLGIEQIGIYDNFFELGGHSLLGTQVISRIREALQVELSLHNLFEKTTIAGLAALVEKNYLTIQKLQATTSDILGEREEIEV